MRLAKNVVIASIVIAMGSSLGFAADKSLFAIKIHRDLHTGGIYNVEIENEQSRTDIIAPGAPPQVSGGKYSLSGSMKVTAVSSNHNPSRLTFTIKNLTNENSVSLIDPGTVVNVDRSGKETTCASVTGTPLTNDGITALKTVYYPLPRNELPDDQFYGSSDRHAEGDSWPMHSDKLKDYWTSLGWKFGANEITGQSAIDGTESVRGVQMLRLHVSADLKNATPPFIPASLHVDKSELHAEMTAWIPADTSSEASIEDMSQDIHLTLRDPATSNSWDTKLHAKQKETIFPAK